MTIQAGNSQRITWMDQLRGLAAFFVIAHHFYFADLGLTVSQYWNFGILGVTIFFCISGYVIPLSIKKSGHLAVKNFAVSRFFRLYPAYWLSILFGVLLLGATFKQILFNVTMFQELFLVKSIIGVYWTLTVELCYYLIIAFLVWHNQLKNKAVLIFLSLFFSVVSLLFALVRFYLNIKSPLALPLGLSIMFFMTYYCITINFHKQEFKIDAKLLIIPALLILSYFYGYSKDWGFNENPYRFILMNSLGIMLFFIYPKINLKSNLILLMGKVSYSSYLLHIPVAKLVDVTFPNTNIYVTLLFKFLLVYLVAWLSYKFIESPFIDLSKRYRKEN